MILWAEFLAIFVAVPLLFYFRVLPNAPIPALIAFAAGASVYLHRKGYRLADFLAWPGWPALVPMLLRAALLCLIIGLFVWRVMPDKLFEFPRRAPAFWAMVMLLYPLLSVLPQEILFRAFFFERYRPIFANDMSMALASALAFGFVHIIFGNWISVGLSAVGGVLFAITYLQTGSLLAACVEHAIFGDFIFTIGLGEYFFHGSRR